MPQKILTILLCFDSLLIGSQQLNSQSIDDIFRNEWRQTSVSTINKHLKRHPECELKATIPTLESMLLYFPANYFKRGKFAESFPDKRRLDSGFGQIVFINRDIEWSERQAVIILIHEASHVTPLGDGWICGPDGVNGSNSWFIKSNPVCRLFGECQYSSEEITEIIKRHLAEEMMGLDD